MLASSSSSLVESNLGCCEVSRSNDLGMRAWYDRLAAPSLSSSSQTSNMTCKTWVMLSMLRSTSPACLFVPFVVVMSCKRYRRFAVSCRRPNRSFFPSHTRCYIWFSCQPPRLSPSFSSSLILSSIPYILTAFITFAASRVWAKSACNVGNPGRLINLQLLLPFTQQELDRAEIFLVQW